MPYKNSKLKLKIPRKKDRRVKLSLEDRAIIKRLYSTGKYSQRRLARMFNVSRRLIVFIVRPETKERDLYLRALRGGSKIYYDRVKQVVCARDCRRFRQNLYLNGELVKNKNEGGI